VEKDEKRGQLPAAPVHRDMATFKVWQQIVQNFLFITQCTSVEKF
jgi:hypothetical protein